MTSNPVSLPLTNKGTITQGVCFCFQISLLHVTSASATVPFRIRTHNVDYLNRIWLPSWPWIELLNHRNKWPAEAISPRGGRSCALGGAWLRDRGSLTSWLGLNGSAVSLKSKRVSRLPRDHWKGAYTPNVKAVASCPQLMAALPHLTRTYRHFLFHKNCNKTCSVCVHSWSSGGQAVGNFWPHVISVADTDQCVNWASRDTA